MIETLIDHLILLIVSLIANILSAMAGGGAGLLQLPALIFLGLPFSIALATHKIATVALGVGATFKHSQQKTTRLPLALVMLGFGLPGVIIGAKAVLSIPEPLAKTFLGVLTAGLGLYSMVKKSLGQDYHPKHSDWQGHLLGGIGLFVLGFLNGALSSGTGLFVTLWLVTWYGFDYKRATAYTMILVGLFWNGTGAVTFAMLTEVQWDWLPMLLLGSLLGGYVGASLAVKHGNPVIKKVFEVVTLLVGLSLIVSGITG